MDATRFAFFWLVLLSAGPGAVLGLSACDGGGSPASDAGTDAADDAQMPPADAAPTDAAPTDAAPTDAGPAGCGAAREIALTMGEQTIRGDTTGRTAALDVGCGREPSPQEILALTIPGTAPVGVEITLATDGTSADFDTILVVRPEACDSAEGELCFDDAGGDYRSTGTFTAMGGQTVHVVIGGYDASNAGPWEARVTVAANAPPTLTAATARLVDGSRHDFVVSGGDEDGNAAGVRLEFLRGDGTEIEAEGLDFVDIGFVDPVAGMTTFTDALARVVNLFDDLPALIDATQVRVRVVDRFGATSEAMTVPIAAVSESRRGGACDAEHVCADGLECTAGACAIPAAAQAACMAATEITGSMSVTGTVPAGRGLFYGSCGNTRGAEVLYRITLSGTSDILATTDVAATGMADTVLYLQSVCGDSATEPAGGCNDDIARDNLRSRISLMDVAAGTYTLVVEGYGVQSEPMPFGLQVTLRPVRAAGQSCDPAGMTDRCATGLTCTGSPPTCTAGS